LSKTQRTMDTTEFDGNVEFLTNFLRDPEVRAHLRGAPVCGAAPRAHAAAAAPTNHARPHHSPRASPPCAHAAPRRAVAGLLTTLIVPTAQRLADPRRACPLPLAKSRLCCGGGRDLTRTPRALLSCHPQGAPAADKLRSLADGSSKDGSMRLDIDVNALRRFNAGKTAKFIQRPMQFMAPFQKAAEEVRDCTR